MMYDNRTKPESQWTYYVVDNIPKMANLYRYDTVEEAIEKYKSLPGDKMNGIGSSIHGMYETDHIQCRDGENVLVMDSERSSNSIWRDSPEIQEAIDKMIAYLNVKYQLSSMFGKGFPSAIVELERYSSPELENYFQNKLLRPADPKNLLTAINEVYVEGEGWMKLQPFLKKLDDSRPQAMGEGAKSNFVTRVNIDYIDETGRCGQADLSTRNFVLLQEKTAREVAPEKLAEDLYKFAADVDPYDAMDQEDIKDEEIESLKKDIASDFLAPYIEKVSEWIKEGLPSEEDHKRALSLLSRLTVLTPPEFRKRSLITMIQNAEAKAGNQQKTGPQKHRNDMEH